jgi:cell division transport system permease protein
MIKKVGMIVRYNIIGYLLSEGFKNVLKNKKSTGASLMIMCATMLIFGLFFLIGENVNYIVKEVESEQGMQVFMYKDATEEQIEKLGNELKSLDYVAKVTFVSKEEAINSIKSRWGDKSERLLKAYEGDKNPLGVSFIVTLTDLEKSEEVKTNVENLENVKEIKIQDQVISALLGVANGIQIISGVILALLIIISIFIIANTIKLTVHARRKEISIMKYVGATNGFIRWPFIVEGVIIGILSAMISILILGIGYNFIIDKILTSTIATNIGISLLTFSDIFGLVIAVYLLLGIGIGILGSVISMRKYLEV